MFALPAIIFFLALALRLFALDWGLPDRNHQQSYHPDEPVVWMYSQTIQPASLDFTPGFYNYGTLYLTTLKIASDVVAGYSSVKLDPEKPADTWNFIGRAHLAGRVISALAGAGTALLVFFILRRLSTDFGAVFGGLAIAFAPAHVVHSRFQTVDILATFFIAASSYYALRLLPKEGAEPEKALRLAIWSGLFTGLSAGTKYTGILCLITLLIVALGAYKSKGVRFALAGTAAAVLAFLVTTPGILLETSAFLEGFLYETAHVKAGHGLIFEGTSHGAVFHFQNLMTGLGLLTMLIGFGGLASASSRKQFWAIGLLGFFVVYYLLIAGAEVKFIRYTFPLYVALAVGFGWAIGQAREVGGKWHGLVALGILGLGGLPGGGLSHALRYSMWMLKTDPRDMAGEYLRGKDVTVGLVSDPWFYTPSFHPALGRRLVFERGMPFVSMRPYDGAWHMATESLSEPAIARYVPKTPDGSIDLGARLDWDERLISESKPDYIVYSSFETENLFRISQLANPSPVGKATSARAQVFMERLKREYDVDKVFGSGDGLIHDLMYVQPQITIWKRKPVR